MRNLKVHFSSKTNQWSTPQDLFDVLNREFGFELDVCADESNAKCSRYFTEEDDALAQEWTGTCWMNPPYGRGLIKWMRKAYESAEAGATVVCLVFARTDTAWWHDYAGRGEIRAMPGRLKFGGAKSSAPCGSVVVIFRRRPPTFTWWDWKGTRGDSNAPVPLLTVGAGEGYPPRSFHCVVNWDWRAK